MAIDLSRLKSDLRQIKEIIENNKSLINAYEDFLWFLCNALEGLAGLYNVSLADDSFLKLEISKKHDCCIKEIFPPVCQDKVVNQIITTLFHNCFSANAGPLDLNNIEKMKEDTIPMRFSAPQEILNAIPLIDKLLGTKGKFDYYSNEFRELRHKVFIRDGEVCAKCGATPKPGKWLEIDHIKPVSKYPELALDINNMQVLCKKCNRQKSNKNCIDYRSVK